MSFNKYLKIIILIFASIVALSVATFSPPPNINECNIEIILDCFPSLDVSADVDLGIVDISAELGSKFSVLNLKSAESSNEFLLCKKLKHKKGKHPHHHHNHKGTKKPKKPKKGKTTTAKPKKHTSVTKNPRPCRAILILELIRIKILRLNIHQQALFDVCINEIEAILLDVKLSLEVKVIKIAFKLKLFFLNNPDIELLICLEEIKGFGKVFEFILLGLKFNLANLEAAIEPLDFEGKSHLTIALENAIANNSCEIDIVVKIKLFIKFFKRICCKLDDNWKIERKHAYIAIVLRSFLSNKNDSCLLDAILKAKINGVLSVQEYLVFCDLFVSLSKIGPIVLSGDVNVNVLIKSLSLAINSKINLNVSILIEAKSFLNVVINFFKSEIDVNLRLKFLSEKFVLLSKECQDLVFSCLDLDIDLKIRFLSLIASSNLVSFKI
uniref:Uncharacterized protein n=1 Tax=Meloidogyne enterolobii TaxID=390850 RepID=A0A6V7VNZ1_MELEN|nr:unnamed protein product [Meloidogyne enterolobii]